MLVCMTKAKKTTFSLQDWAATKKLPEKRGHLDRNTRAQEAIREAFAIRATGKSFFTMVDLHEMLTEQKGLTVGVETLRRWVKTNMQDEYTKANF